MARPGGGGGPGQNFFDLTISGPPPGDLTVAKDHWIDLGTIPTGQAIWFGSAYFTSVDKSITFEIRTNNAGESQGTTAKTSVLAKVSASTRKGTVFKDLYRKGRLHTVTVVGTGTEHFWLHLVSKQSALGAYMYQLNYTLE